MKKVTHFRAYSVRELLDVLSQLPSDMKFVTTTQGHYQVNKKACLIGCIVSTALMSVQFDEGESFIRQDSKERDRIQLEVGYDV